MLFRHFRVTCRALFVAAALACALPTGAFAAGKDAQAESAYKKAMEEDYLDTKFDDAEKKLNKAIEACGEKACSPKVKAKLYMGLGIVLAGGKNKLDEARESFAEALKLDPSAAPDPDYVKSEIKFAFDEAKKTKKGPSTPSGTGGSDSGATDGPMSHTPPPEQKLNTPIPIYVTLDDDTLKKVTNMEAIYEGVGASAQRKVRLERNGKTFRGNIPCAATSKKGAVKYWITAKDKDDKVVGTIGSEAAPNETQIKEMVEGKTPSWPGFAPPESCGESEEELRARSSGRQCVDNGDCPAEERCATNTCLLRPKASTQGEGEGEGDKPKELETGEKKRRHWLTLAFVPDFPVVSGSDICSKAGQTDQHFVCSRADGKRYTGTPTAGQGNNVNGGLGVGTMRLMIGYDGVIVDNFSLGARVGYAFNGTSKGGASFLPVHLEARAMYAFGSRAYTGAVVRPWIFVNGGLAQVDSTVKVQVVEDGKACGAANPNDFKSPCTDWGKAGGTDGNTRIQTLDAAKQAGQGFVGGGAGISFLPAKMFAINLAFRFSATVPVFVPVLSPEAGVSLGF